MNSGSTLSQSREFRRPRPITICFPAAMSNLQFTTRLSTSPGAQIDIIICACSTCPRHPSLVLQYPQSNPGEGSQPGQSIVSQPANLQTRSESQGPTVVAAGLACLARIDLFWILSLRSQRNQASNAIPPATHPPPKASGTGFSQSNSSDVRLHNLLHDAYTRFWLDTACKWI